MFFAPRATRTNTPPRNFVLAVLLSFFFGVFGVGEWYLGHRKRALFLLLLLPFGGLGFWWGVARAIYIALRGEELFDAQYGRPKALPMAQSVPSGWARMEQYAAPHPRPAAMSYATQPPAVQKAYPVGAPPIATSPLSNAQAQREALIAGHLNIETYLELQERTRR